MDAGVCLQLCFLSFMGEDSLHRLSKHGLDCHPQQHERRGTVIEGEKEMIVLVQYKTSAFTYARKDMLSHQLVHKMRDLS